MNVPTLLFFELLVFASVIVLELCVGKAWVHFWHAFTHIKDREDVAICTSHLCNLPKLALQCDSVSRSAIDDHLLVVMCDSVAASEGK